MIDPQKVIIALLKSNRLITLVYFCALIKAVLRVWIAAIYEFLQQTTVKSCLLFSIPVLATAHHSMFTTNLIVAF